MQVEHLFSYALYHELWNQNLIDRKGFIIAEGNDLKRYKEYLELQPILIGAEILKDRKRVLDEVQEALKLKILTRHQSKDLHALLESLNLQFGEEGYVVIKSDIPTPKKKYPGVREPSLSIWEQKIHEVEEADRIQKRDISVLDCWLSQIGGPKAKVRKPEYSPAVDWKEKERSCRIRTKRRLNEMEVKRRNKINNFYADVDYNRKVMCGIKLPREKISGTETVEKPLFLKSTPRTVGTSKGKTVTLGDSSERGKISHDKRDSDKSLKKLRQEQKINKKAEKKDMGLKVLVLPKVYEEREVKVSAFGDHVGRSLSEREVLKKKKMRKRLQLFQRMVARRTRYTESPKGKEIKKRKQYVPQNAEDSVTRDLLPGDTNEEASVETGSEDQTVSEGKGQSRHGKKLLPEKSKELLSHLKCVGKENGHAVVPGKMARDEKLTKMLLRRDTTQITFKISDTPDELQSLVESNTGREREIKDKLHRDANEETTVIQKVLKDLLDSVASKAAEDRKERYFLPEDAVMESLNGLLNSCASNIEGEERISHLTHEDTSRAKLSMTDVEEKIDFEGKIEKPLQEKEAKETLEITEILDNLLNLIASKEKQDLSILHSSSLLKERSLKKDTEEKYTASRPIKDMLQATSEEPSMEERIKYLEEKKTQDSIKRISSLLDVELSEMEDTSDVNQLKVEIFGYPRDGGEKTKPEENLFPSFDSRQHEIPISLIDSAGELDEVLSGDRKHTDARYDATLKTPDEKDSGLFEKSTKEGFSTLQQHDNFNDSIEDFSESISNSSSVLKKISFDTELIKATKITLSSESLDSDSSIVESKPENYTLDEIEKKCTSQSKIRNINEESLRDVDSLTQQKLERVKSSLKLLIREEERYTASRAIENMLEATSEEPSMEERIKYLEEKKTQDSIKRISSLLDVELSEMEGTSEVNQLKDEIFGYARDEGGKMKPPEEKHFPSLDSRQHEIPISLIDSTGELDQVLRGDRKHTDAQDDATLKTPDEKDSGFFEKSVKEGSSRLQEHDDFNDRIEDFSESISNSSPLLKKISFDTELIKATKFTLSSESLGSDSPIVESKPENYTLDEIEKKCASQSKTRNINEESLRDVDNLTQQKLKRSEAFELLVKGEERYTAYRPIDDMLQATSEEPPMEERIKYLEEKKTQDSIKRISSLLDVELSEIEDGSEVNQLKVEILGYPRDEGEKMKPEEEHFPSLDSRLTQKKLERAKSSLKLSVREKERYTASRPILYMLEATSEEPSMEQRIRYLEEKKTQDSIKRISSLLDVELSEIEDGSEVNQLKVEMLGYPRDEGEKMKPEEEHFPSLDSRLTQKKLERAKSSLKLSVREKKRYTAARPILYMQEATSEEPSMEQRIRYLEEKKTQDSIKRISSLLDVEFCKIEDGSEMNQLKVETLSYEGNETKPEENDLLPLDSREHEILISLVDSAGDLNHVLDLSDKVVKEGSSSLQKHDILKDSIKEFSESISQSSSDPKERKFTLKSSHIPEHSEEKISDEKDLVVNVTDYVRHFQTIEEKLKNAERRLSVMAGKDLSLERTPSREQKSKRFSSRSRAKLDDEYNKVRRGSFKDDRDMMTELIPGTSKSKHSRILPFRSKKRQDDHDKKAKPKPITSKQSSSLSLGKPEPTQKELDLQLERDKLKDDDDLSSETKPSTSQAKQEDNETTRRALPRWPTLLNVDHQNLSDVSRAILERTRAMRVNRGLILNRSLYVNLDEDKTDKKDK